jgi:hypothetical protein
MGQEPVWRAGAIAVTIEDFARDRAGRWRVCTAPGTKEAARKAAS